MSPDPAVSSASSDAERERAGHPGRTEGGAAPQVRAARANKGTTPEAVARAAMKQQAAGTTADPSATAKAKPKAEPKADPEADPKAERKSEPDAPAKPPRKGTTRAATADTHEPDTGTSPAVGPPADASRLVTAEEVMTKRQRKQANRLRARKVRRVVRNVDAWSVLKVSLVFYLCSYVIGLVSGVILWNIADRAGYIEKIEGFIEDLFAYETFEFLPGTLFNAVALGGAVLAIIATGLTALSAVLFNLISDLMGGIRLTMIEFPGAKPALRPRKAAKVAARVAPRTEPTRREATSAASAAAVD